MGFWWATRYFLRCSFLLKVLETFLLTFLFFRAPDSNEPGLLWLISKVRFSKVLFFLNFFLNETLTNVSFFIVGFGGGTFTRFRGIIISKSFLYFL